MQDPKNYFIELEGKINKNKFQPASYLRRVFSVDQEIQKAEIQISCCGLYECYINGKTITDQKFLPGFTYYKKRLQYQTFDITPLLRKGQNVIGVIIGDGWHRGKIGIFSKRYYYGTKTKIAAILRINYEDQSETILYTDSNWRATQDGPIRKSDWKDGEIYDATKELIGWLEPDFDDIQWHKVYPSKYNGKLVPSEGEPILEHENFVPEIFKTPDGSTVLDFKQNLFGYVEFTVSGKYGQAVRLIHGETLDENGNFTQKNLVLEGLIFKKKKKFQEIEYILKDGTQTYKPHFTGHGFRYVKLENWPEPVKPENFASIAVYSDCKQIGHFECSHPLINQLVQNAMWSQKSNFVDIPTDCPQRERAGWTGDIACYCPTAAYFMNVEKFLSKWMKDLSLQQTAEGRVGSIVPDVGLPQLAKGAAGWADAATIVPYELYKAYGNKSILSEQYESMVNWVKFLKNRAKKTHPSRWLKKNPLKKYTIDSGFQFGEWLEPGNVMLWDLVKGFFNPDFEVATAYYAYSCKLMSEIAEVLGKTEDSREYKELFERIKEGYRFNYTDDGKIKSARHCKYVRPVVFDLISEKEKKEVISNLNNLVIKNDYKIGTGFLTTPFLLKVLSDFGYVETAYKILENEERPGWLYEVKKGATTIWENWNGIDDDGVPRDSFNHYLMGSVVGWLFSHVAGIRPLEPGYSKILVKPIPGGSIKYVKCSYESSSGMIKSSWKLDEDNFHLEIEVPTTTEIHLPNGNIHNVEKGIHKFNCEL